MDPYLGMIIIFGGNFEINRWAYCRGQLLPISQNAALFSILGTTYGGDGVQTYALPDLRGRVPVGIGQGPNLSNYALGQTGGTETVILTIGNLPPHTHPVDASNLVIAPAASTAAATTNIPGPTLVPAKLPTVGAGPSASTIKGYAASDATTTLAPATVTGTFTAGAVGGNQPVNIRMPYLAMNYLIALQGIFPSRA
jgi:microcystin-dependent protein